MLTLPQRTLETFKIPQIEFIGDKLPANPTKPPWPKRTPSMVKYIVIHHSASTGTLEAENRYHIMNNNWYRLSYHFSIDRGRIVQINDILDITSHALGANTNGIGICVNWDLRLRGLTDFERSALYGIVTTLKDMFPNAEIVGHNEISKRLANHSTSCPMLKMDDLRADITSAEERLDYASQPSALLVKAFAIADRIKSLCERIGDPKYGAECLRKVMLFASVESLETSEDVRKRVVEDLYTKAVKGLSEAVRKLGLYYALAEEKGLL